MPVPGIAVREVPTLTGPADYVLFLDRKACAVLEEKPEGVTLLGTGPQAADYAAHAPADYPHWGDPLPFTYLSTGSETLFRDGADPAPVALRVFAVHRPEAFRNRFRNASSVCANRTRALVQWRPAPAKPTPLVRSRIAC